MRLKQKSAGSPRPFTRNRAPQKSLALSLTDEPAVAGKPELVDFASVPEGDWHG